MEEKTLKISLITTEKDRAFFLCECFVGNTKYMSFEMDLISFDRKAHDLMKQRMIQNPHLYEPEGDGISGCNCGEGGGRPCES